MISLGFGWCYLRMLPRGRMVEWSLMIGADSETWKVRPGRNAATMPIQLNQARGWGAMRWPNGPFEWGNSRGLASGCRYRVEALKQREQNYWGPGVWFGMWIAAGFCQSAP